MNVEIPNIPFVQVKYIDVVFKQPQPLSGLQTYKLDLNACVVIGDAPCMPIPGANQTFTDGRFIDEGDQGSMFIPRASDPPSLINQILKIQWCPNQNYFLVKFAGQPLFPLRHYPSMISAAVSPSADTLADTSGGCPKKGDPCNPSALDTCCSTADPPSGLKCVDTPFTPPAIGSIYTCQ